jgi:hypothetical protein
VAASFVLSPARADVRDLEARISPDCEDVYLSDGATCTRDLAPGIWHLYVDSVVGTAGTLDFEARHIEAEPEENPVFLSGRCTFSESVVWHFGQEIECGVSERISTSPGATSVEASRWRRVANANLWEFRLRVSEPSLFSFAAAGDGAVRIRAMSETESP